VPEKRYLTLRAARLHQHARSWRRPAWFRRPRSDMSTTLGGRPHRGPRQSGVAEAGALRQPERLAAVAAALAAAALVIRGLPGQGVLLAEGRGDPTRRVMLKEFEAENHEADQVMATLVARNPKSWEAFIARWNFRRDLCLRQPRQETLFSFRKALLLNDQLLHHRLRHGCCCGIQLVARIRLDGNHDHDKPSRHPDGEDETGQHQLNKTESTLTSSVRAAQQKCFFHLACGFHQFHVPS